MANLQTYKKPNLAILEEKTKIRDYSFDKKILNSTKIVRDLLIDLGVGTKVDEEQHKRVVKFISEECGEFSYEEVQEAFKMVLRGDLEMDLFQQINVLVVSKVLRLYQKNKNEKLKNYRLSKNKTDSISDEEKAKLRIDGVRKQLTYFFHNRKVDETRIYVYDVFDKKGLMPTDIEYKNSVKKDAMKILKDHYNNVIKSSREEFKEIKNIVNDINNGKGAQLVWKCKELALEDYLRKELKKESDIERLIDVVR